MKLLDKIKNKVKKDDKDRNVGMASSTFGVKDQNSAINRNKTFGT